MNTAELLVKESEGIMEANVLIPIILQKCASRGYEPKNETEMQYVLKTASYVRDSLAAEDAEMNKAASTKEIDEIEISLDELDPVIKEAAAVSTWAALEAIAADNNSKS